MTLLIDFVYSVISDILLTNLCAGDGVCGCSECEGNGKHHQRAQQK